MKHRPTDSSNKTEPGGFFSGGLDVGECQASPACINLSTNYSKHLTGAGCIVLLCPSRPAPGLLLWLGMGCGKWIYRFRRGNTGKRFDETGLSSINVIELWRH